MKPAHSALLALAVLATACSPSDPSSTAADGSPDPNFGPTGIPPHLRATHGPDGNRVSPGGNNPDLTKIKLTPLDEIVFTKPDTSAEQPTELTELLAAPKSKTWEQSDSAARSRAAREGKPVLYWFTDPMNSPMCRVMHQELLTDTRFEAWASEKLIRVKVDMRYRTKDPNLSIDDAQAFDYSAKHYAETLKKRYKVTGYPTLVMLNADGEVIGRFSGYKRGTAATLWGQLKHAEGVASRAYAEWRARMEKKGYRQWHDRRGRGIFAKLASYHQGELILIDPEGSRFRTQEGKLSAADAEWIAEQKRLRGMP